MLELIFTCGENFITKLQVQDSILLSCASWVISDMIHPIYEGSIDIDIAEFEFSVNDSGLLFCIISFINSVYSTMVINSGGYTITINKVI